MPGPLSLTVITAKPSRTVRPVSTLVPCRCVSPGVGQQVGHDLIQPMPIAEGADRFVGQRQAPGVLRSGRPGVADRIDHDLGEVDGLDVEVGTGIEPGEQQQIIDQMRHPLGLRLDA